MIKGNFWTRSVKGRLGDMVFYKSKGEQMTRSYNGNPANPRTDKQLIQRSKWVNTCNAYALLRPFIADTFIKRPQDQNNFNAFVSANVGLSPVVDRLSNEDNKKNVSSAVAPYVITNGSLSGFPKSKVLTFVEFPTDTADLNAGIEVPISDNVIEWVQTQLGEETSVSVPFGDFYRAVMADLSLPNSHIGVLVASADGNLNLDKYFYWEFFDGADLPAMTFEKDASGILQPARVSVTIGDFDVIAHFLPEDGLIFFAVTSIQKMEFAGAVFRCEYAPAINTEKTSLVLSPNLAEHLADLADPSAVADAIASYRRGLSAEDEQVFNG